VSVWACRDLWCVCWCVWRIWQQVGRWEGVRLGWAGKGNGEGRGGGRGGGITSSRGITSIHFHEYLSGPGLDPCLLPAPTPCSAVESVPGGGARVRRLVWPLTLCESSPWSINKPPGKPPVSNLKCPAAGRDTMISPASESIRVHHLDSRLTRSLVPGPGPAAAMQPSSEHNCCRCAPS
jgi:hypothetical protein